MSEVTVSLVAQFDASGGGQLSAEFDARPTGFNKGRTSFIPGDQPAFLVFKSSDVEITAVESSTGSIALLGTGLFSVSEDLQFANVTEATLQKPFYSGFSYKWLGNNLGTPTPSEGKVVIPNTGVGMLRITYNALYTAYRLSNVGDADGKLNGETSYGVLIVVTGEKS